MKRYVVTSRKQYGSEKFSKGFWTLSGALEEYYKLCDAGVGSPKRMITVSVKNRYLTGEGYKVKTKVIDYELNEGVNVVPPTETFDHNMG